MSLRRTKEVWSYKAGRRDFVDCERCWPVFHATLLKHENLGKAPVYAGQQTGNPDQRQFLSVKWWKRHIHNDPQMIKSAAMDIKSRPPADPAVDKYSTPLLCT